MNVCDRRSREALPEVAAGRADRTTADRVAAHRLTCPACDGELRLLEALAAERPPVSPAVAERLELAVAEAVRHARSARRRRRVPSWALAAAAAAVLALGTPAIYDRVSSRGLPSDAELAAATSLGSVWVTDELLVAGAPVLESLSDDEIERLLEEMAR